LPLEKQIKSPAALIWKRPSSSPSAQLNAKQKRATINVTDFFIIHKTACKSTTFFLIIQIFLKKNEKSVRYLHNCKKSSIFAG